MAGGDEIFRAGIHGVEIVGGEIQVAAPVKAQPPDHCLDGIDVLLLFLFRIGVVEAQMAHAGIITRQTEVEKNRLGMPIMQITVRLGRETGFHPAAPFSDGILLIDDVADEIGGRGIGNRSHGRGGTGSMNVANEEYFIGNLRLSLSWAHEKLSQRFLRRAKLLKNVSQAMIPPPRQVGPS